MSLSRDEFAQWAHHLADWMVSYYDTVAELPVAPKDPPCTLLAQLPAHAPQQGESMEAIWDDFLRLIVPQGVHWQSPHFHAYFPAAPSRASLLGEMATAALAQQAMGWNTSPAATELEMAVMRWLAAAMGLPDVFTGVIHDSASNATLSSLLTARERATQFTGNTQGLGSAKLVAYCSAEAHSSIDKAVRMAGLGSAHLRRIAVDSVGAMRVDALRQAIEADLAAGLQPCWLVGAFGTTGTTAVDDLNALAAVAADHGLWFHVDAAYAGAALLLPECRALAAGIERADSVVFNPHKWLLTHFDCSAYFVRDPQSLVRTFEVSPEYLKTAAQPVPNFRDWGPGLGRRFRALKLWFVLRSFGIEGLQRVLRNHLAWAKALADQVHSSTDFELMAPVRFGLVCLRYTPAGVHGAACDALNARLRDTLNGRGKIFLTHTRFANALILRVSLGGEQLTEAHVQATWQEIVSVARGLH